MDTRRPTAQTGFTLIELLMTIAIAAIVAMLAIPSFQYVTNSNRVAAEVNGLLGDLQFARAEAINTGQNVTVCLSAGSKTCDTTGNAWQTGWIVYLNPTGTGTNTTIPAAGSILRVQSPFTGTDTFLASPAASAITYNREGYAIVGANNNGTLISLHPASPSAAQLASWARCLSVSTNGMTQTARYNQSLTGVATAVNGVVNTGVTCR
jgi:type IV fimbrial biogenesis protein FimT